MKHLYVSVCERVHEQREMEMDRGKKGGRREARETLNEGRDREREEGKERQKVGGERERKRKEGELVASSRFRRGLTFRPHWSALFFLSPEGAP